MHWKLICSECGAEDRVTTHHGHPCEACQPEAFEGWYKASQERQPEQEAEDDLIARIRARDGRLATAFIVVSIIGLALVVLLMWLLGSRHDSYVDGLEAQVERLETELAFCNEEAPTEGGLYWQICMETLTACSQQNTNMLEEIDAYRRMTDLRYELDCDQRYFLYGWRGWVPVCDDTWRTWLHVLPLETDEDDRGESYAGDD
jgi:hypothetical protein